MPPIRGAAHRAAQPSRPPAAGGHPTSPARGRSPPSPTVAALERPGGERSG